MKFIIGLILLTCNAFAGTETIVKANIVEGQATAKNFIANSHFEKNTVGYSTYLDAVGTRPVDGTGGAPTQLTISRTTSSPLAGEGSLLITNSGSTSAQGEGVSVPFTIDSAQKASLLSIKLNYEVASGTFVSGSDSTDGDLIVYLYDVTNSALIEPVNFKLKAQKGEYVGSFQTSATSTSYRLIFHVASTSTAAWSLKIDDIAVSKLQAQANGSAISAKLVGSSSSISNSGHSLITFTTVEIDSSGQVSSNNTVTIKESGTYSVYGDFQVSLTGGGSSGQNIAAYIYRNGGSVFSGIVPSISSGTFTYNPQVTTVIKLIAGDTIQLKGDQQAVAGSFAVSSASLMVSKIADASASYAGVVVSTIVQNTAGTSIPNGAWTSVPFATTIKDAVGAWSGSTYTAKVAGTYLVKPITHWAANASGQRGQRIRKNGNDTGIGSFTNASAALTVGQSATGEIDLIVGDTITLEVYQSSGGALALSAATDIVNMLSISKLNTDSTVPVPKQINAKYTNAAGTSIPNATMTIIDFATKSWDSNNSVTTGGAWKYTAQEAGKYKVTAHVLLNANTGWAAGEATELYVFKGGSLTELLNYDNRGGGGANINWSVFGATTMQLNAGEYIDIRFQQSSGGAITLVTGSAYNYVTVEKIGD